MNPFLKAAILTIIVIVFAFLMIMQLDNMRLDYLKKDIGIMTYTEQSREVILDYYYIMDNNSSKLCEHLSNLHKKQFVSVYSLATKMQEYQKKSVFNYEYEVLKNSYFLSLLKVYIHSFENNKLCGKNEVPLVFFYSETTNCQLCKVQNDILSNIAKKCKNIRIYAFPSDSSIEIITILSKKYNVSSVPSIVIDDKEKLDGLQRADMIIEILNKTGGQCS